MNKKMTGTEAGTNALALSGLAQLSRNKNINNAGGVLGVVGFILLIGELFKFAIRWLIIKPFMFTAKIMWIFFKYMFMWGAALTLALFQYSYKGFKIIINFSISKYKNKQLEK